MNALHIGDEPAMSATRLNGVWVIQTAYGSASREATEVEAPLIEEQWLFDERTNGQGDDWVQVHPDAMTL